MSKKILYSFILVVFLFLTGISTQATTIIPQIMLLLSNDIEQQQTVNATYDEVQLDMIRLE